MAIPKLRLPRLERPRLHVQQPKSSFAEGNARWSVSSYDPFLSVMLCDDTYTD